MSKEEPLSFLDAISANDLELTKKILERDYPAGFPEEELPTFLILSRLKRLFEFTRLMIQHGADWQAVDEYGDQLEDYATKSANFLLLEYLAREKGLRFWKNRGMKSSQIYPIFRSWPWETAIQMLDFLEKETDFRENPTAMEDLCLGTLLREDDPISHLKTLLKRGYVLPECGSAWPFLLAAPANLKWGVALVKFLLEKGFDPTVQTPRGWTLLGVASAEGNLPLVRYLMEELHVPLKTPGSKGSVMASSTETNCLELVQYLVEKQGADVTEGHVEDHWTALHNACRGGNFEIVSYLVAHGADVNAVGGYAGVTPVHSAASNGNLEILQLLIQHGGRTDVRNWNGSTPLDLAKKKNMRNTRDYLINRKVLQGMQPYENLQKCSFENLPFHELYQKYFLLKYSDLSESVAETVGLGEKADWLLIYGYMDHRAALSFQVLALVVSEKDGRIKFLPYREGDKPLILQGNDLHGTLVACVTAVVDTRPYERVVRAINEVYAKDPDLERMRRDENLDEVRDGNFPDRVLVVFEKEGESLAEETWVEVRRQIEKSVYEGILTEEPCQPVGFHQGDTVRFRLCHETEFCFREKSKTERYCGLAHRK